MAYTSLRMVRGRRFVATGAADCFMARIMDGPEGGGSDYTDERYYVKEVDLSSGGASNLPAQWKTGYRYVTAHNLAEIEVGSGGTRSGGSHLLDDTENILVEVWKVWYDDEAGNQSAYYVFHCEPGGGAEVVLGRMKSSSPYDTGTHLYSVEKWTGSAWDDNSGSYWKLQVPNQPTSDDESLFDASDLVWMMANSGYSTIFNASADFVALSMEPWAAWG